MEFQIWRRQTGGWNECESLSYACPNVFSASFSWRHVQGVRHEAKRDVVVRTSAEVSSASYPSFLWLRTDLLFIPRKVTFFHLPVTRDTYLLPSFYLKHHGRLAEPPPLLTVVSQSMTPGARLSAPGNTLRSILEVGSSRQRKKQPWNVKSFITSAFNHFSRHRIRLERPSVRIYASTILERMNRFSWNVILILSSLSDFGYNRIKITGSLHKGLHAVRQVQRSYYGKRDTITAPRSSFLACFCSVLKILILAKNKMIRSSATVECSYLYRNSNFSSQLCWWEFGRNLLLTTFPLFSCGKVCNVKVLGVSLGIETRMIHLLICLF